MNQGPLLPPPPPPPPPNIDIGDKVNSLANKLLGEGVDALTKKVGDAIEYVDKIDVPAIVEQKLNSVSNTVSYATNVLTDKDQLLGIGKGISDELEDPKTNEILQDLASNVAKTSGDAAINALPAIPVFGALAASAIRATPNITHAVDSFNQLVEKYTEKLDSKIGNKLDSITGTTNADVNKVQTGGFKLKGILRRSKTIEKRTSESIDKFLNPKKTKTGRRKKTNKRLLSKNKTRKRVRFRL
jgi:hypothetical protein